MPQAGPPEAQDPSPEEVPRLTLHQVQHQTQPFPTGVPVAYSMRPTLPSPVGRALHLELAELPTPTACDMHYLRPRPSLLGDRPACLKDCTQQKGEPDRPSL